MEYEVVIGLEVHVQLKTKSKMFTSAPYHYGAAPNTLTDPVVMGLPGTLPVLNKDAIFKTVLFGRMLGCEIAEFCHWDRKNYFYPDLPKNYQISQFDQALCKGGRIEIELPGPARNIMGAHRHVRLNRIHLEEDVGKLTHFDVDSLVDYNRAGCPLAEIVTEPDLFSPEEVVAYLNALRTLLLYTDVSDCDMEKGQLRCDANISLRPKGSQTLGEKVELKNLNSISGVKNGVIYEIKRQTEVLRSGGSVHQETRRWDAEKGVSFSMRSKEQAHDYRYFPDPDLMPVHLTREVIEAGELPESPFDKQRRYMDALDLPYTLTSVLCPDRALSEYFEQALSHHSNPKGIANWISNDLLRLLREAGTQGSLSIKDSRVTPKALAELVSLIDKGTLTKQLAQEVLNEMFETGKAAQEIVEAKGLAQSFDADLLTQICKDVIEQNPKPVDEFRAGKEPALNALKGQVMRHTKGKAPPQEVDRCLRALLG